MGFLKDVNKLRKVGKEANRNFDVKEAMANAQQQMETATESMRAAEGVGDLAERGERATAQVLASRTTKMQVNYSPMLELDLMVFREGKPPYPATTTISSAAGMPAAGQTVNVLVDPADPNRVFIT